jgi:hypothetical protein
MMMKAVYLMLLLCMALCSSCPHDLEVRCIDYIATCYDIARKKEEETPFDLDCLTYYGRVEPECWPCFCWATEQQKMRIDRCSQAGMAEDITS